MKYKVDCRFVFDGMVEVDADDPEVAQQLVWGKMNATIGQIGNGEDENIKDWNFSHWGEIEVEHTEEVK